MNERATGVMRPRKTAQSSQRSNQRSARVDAIGGQVQPAAVALEERTAAPVADPPTDVRADLVAEHAGGDDERGRH